MRTSAWVGVYVLSTLSLIGLSSFAAPWSPDGTQMAYSFIAGPENIYLVGADGANPVSLVVRPERDFRPVWSPDGSHLLFTGVVENMHVIMRVDVDGQNLQQLTQPEEAAGDPDYSPDGTQILYFTDEPQPRDLYLKNVETGEVSALTSTENFEEYSPRWSPDGSQVVFIGSTGEENAEGDIWLLSIASGERVNLTNTPKFSEFHVEFSSDGKQLVYSRAADGVFSVAVRDLETGVENVVADGGGYAVLSPHFSPDGSELSFTRTDFAEKGPEMPAIVRLSLKTGEERTVIQGRYLSQMEQDQK
jgi:Tol biopolymer transport system component